MPNTFDPYREALVTEPQTIWPADLPGVPQSDADRESLEARLHAQPALAAELEYVRLPTGFIRKITVTPADLERLRSGA
jgi:hypothetical protein